MEGKSVNGIGSDINPVNPAAYSIDFLEDLKSRDFTVGALWYDVVNKIVVDPSGTGVDDAINKILRIAPEKAHWPQWWQTNPLKLLRYWKMKTYGFKPDKETRDFVIQITKQVYNTHLIGGESIRFIGYLQKPQEFSKVLEEDLGVGAFAAFSTGQQFKFS